MNNLLAQAPTIGNLNITIESIREFYSPEDLRALVTVRLKDEVTIRSLNVVLQPGQKDLFYLPQREWLDEGGNKHYTAVITLPDKTKDLIREEILKVWEGWQI